MATAAFRRTFHPDGKKPRLVKVSGCKPTPFYYSYHPLQPYNHAVCAPAEWAETLTLFHLYQYTYVHCGLLFRVYGMRYVHCTVADTVDQRVLNDLFSRRRMICLSSQPLKKSEKERKLADGKGGGGGGGAKS